MKCIGLLLHMLLLVFAQVALAQANDPAKAAFQKAASKALDQQRLFILGQVLDDRTSLPLAGVNISLTSETGSTTLTTDATGQFKGYLSGSAIQLSVNHAGFLPAYRQAPTQQIAWQVRDIRLTPRAASQAQPYVNQDLSIVHNSGFSSTPALTFVDPQALPALLPAGYSPITTFEIQADGGAADLNLQLQSVKANYAAASTLVSLSLQESSWRVLAQHAVTLDQVQLASAQPGTYALAALDPGTAAPSIDTLLTTSTPTPASASVLSSALTDPAVVSILDEPQTDFFLQAGTASDTPSGAFARVTIREYRNHANGTQTLPQRQCDIALYRFGLRPRQTTSGRLPIRSDLSEEERMALLSARMRFDVSVANTRAYGFTRDGIYQSGPLTLDVSAQSTQPVAVAIKRLSNVFPPLGQVRQAFDLSLAETFAGNLGLSITSDAAEALILTKKQPDNSWLFAGAFSYDSGLWTLNSQRANLKSSGIYAIVALPWPISEITGTVSDQATPVADAIVYTSAHPYRNSADANGDYFLFVPQLDSKVFAFNPQNFRQGQRQANGTPASPLLTQQDIALNPADFQLVEHDPADGTQYVETLPELQLFFSMPPTRDASLLSNAINLRDASNTDYPLHYFVQDNSVRLLPQQTLPAETSFTLSVTTNLQDTFGNSLQNAVSFSFSTRSSAAQNTAQLDLTRFYLTEDNGVLNLNAPQGSFPDQLYLVVLNLASASSAYFVLDGNSDWQAPVDGVAGNTFELSATSKDGRQFFHRVDLVKLGVNEYALGSQPFTIEVDNTTIRFDGSADAAGVRVGLYPVDPADVQTSVDQTPALENLPPEAVPIAGIDLVNLDGGKFPLMNARIELDMSQFTEPITLMSFLLLDEMVLPSPEATEKVAMTTVRLADRVSVDPTQAAAKSRGNKRFNLIQATAMLDTALTTCTCDTRWGAMGIPPMDRSGTGSGHINFHAWSVRELGENQSTNRIPINETVLALLPNVENIEMAPNTTMWGNINAATNGFGSAGTIPVGSTDENGELWGGYYHGPLVPYSAVDPLTGARVNSTMHNIKEWEWGGPWYTEQYYSANHIVRFLPREPEGITSSDLQVQWLVGRMQSFADNEQTLWQEDLLLTDKINEEQSVKVLDPEWRLAVKVQLKNGGDFNIDDLLVEGIVNSFDRILVQKPHEIVGLLPPGLLQTTRKLSFRFNAIVSGSLVSLDRKLLVFEDLPQTDLEGPPFVLYAPSGDGYSMSQPLEIVMSEPCRNWLSAVKLYQREANTWMPVTTRILGADGNQILSDQVGISNRVTLIPDQPLGFDSEYRLDIEPTLTDLADNPLFVQEDPWQTAPDDTFAGFRSLFATPPFPEHHLPLEGRPTRQTIAWHQNLMVLYETYNGTIVESDTSPIRYREGKLYVYDYRNPYDPELVQELPVRVPYWHPGPFQMKMAIFTPDMLAPDEISMQPKKFAYHLDHLPSNTFLVMASMNKGTYNGSTLVQQQHRLDFLRIIEDGKDSRKVDYIGDSFFPEAGQMTDMQAFGSYLVASFEELIVQNGATVVLDIRKALSYVQTFSLGSNFAHQRFLSTGLAQMENQNRYPHPTNVDDLEVFFRTDNAGNYKPTLLLAGEEFPGIYAFQGSGLLNPTGAAIDDLPWVDARYLTRTSWGTGSTSDLYLENTTSATEVTYDDPTDGLRIDDFALFSAATSAGGQVLVFRLDDDDLAVAEATPYRTLEFDDVIRAIAYDQSSGLLAISKGQDRFDIEIYDLRTLLETNSADFSEALIHQTTSAIPFSEEMRFYNGVLYENGLYANAIVLPIAPQRFYDVSVNLITDSDNNGTLDETDDAYELHNRGRLVEYVAESGDDSDNCQQNNKRNNSDRSRTPSEPAAVEIQLDIKNEFNLAGEVELDWTQGLNTIELYEPGSETPLQLPISWPADQVPPMLEARAIAQGPAILEMRFRTDRGVVVQTDQILLTGTFFLRGPGLVNGSDYMREYTYAIPQDPSGQETNDCRDIQRTIGFELGHPAKVTFTYGDEKIFDDEWLVPGVYEHPIQLEEPRRVDWDFQLAYTGDYGTVSDYGYIEVIREIKSRLNVGATSVKGVNLNSGLLSLANADITLPGFGPTLEFTRHYVSTGSQEYNPLGPGWQHNWQTRLVYGDCGTLKVIGGDGSGMQYDVDTGLPIMRGIHSYLIPNAEPFGDPVEEGGFTLVTRRGVRWVYGDPLPVDTTGPFTPLAFKQNLLYVEDTFGNRVTVLSESTEHTQITRVLHDDGRALTFDYDTTGYYPLLKQVGTENVDPAITITYSHDAHNRLNQVSRNGGYVETFQYAEPCLSGMERNRILGYTNANGFSTQYQYDSDGQITSIIEPEGVVTNFSYDFTPGAATATVSNPLATTNYQFNFHGQPTQISGPLGTKTMVWAENDVLLLSEVNEAGQSISYQYDLNGNLIERDIEGAIETWTYDLTWNKPTSHTDRLGNTTTWALDGETGSTISMVDAEGGETSFEYDGRGLLTSTNDANNNVTTTTYDSLGNPTNISLPDGASITRSFDSRGRMLSETKPGGTTTVSYNLLDQLLSASTTVAGGPARTTTYSGYKPMGQPASISQGIVSTTYTYDALNRVTSETSDPGANQPVVTNNFSYNVHGNVTQTTVTSTTGTRTFASSFDAAGRLLSTTLNGQPYQSFTYLTGTTLKTSATDWRGATVSYTYDDLLHISSKTLATGHTETYSNNSMGKLVSFTDGDGRTTSYSYDGLLRVTSTTNPAGHTINNSYDANSNLLSSVNSTTGAGFNRTYDSMNRIVSDTLLNSSGNQTTNISYSVGGLVVTKTPPAQATIVETYNVMGDLVSREQNGITTGYTYDANGGIAQISHPMGYVTNLVHDGFGRPVSAAFPEGYTSSWSYDGFGNIISQTDRRGVAITSTYDIYNRPLTRNYIASFGSASESWIYTQNAGNVTVEQTDFRGHTITRNLDVHNRVLQISDPLRGTASNSYSAYNRTASTDFNGNSFSYTYDGLNRLLNQNTPGGTIGYSYSDSVNQVTITDRRGIATTNQYDTLGNLLSRTLDSTQIEAHSYDAANRPISSTDGAGITTSRSYDTLGRLLSETTGPETTTYSSYDDLGRPGSVSDGRSTSTYTYDFYGNTLTRTNGEGETTSMTYDADGNLLSRTEPGPLGNATYTYSYNLLNQITEVQDPLGNATNLSWDGSYTSLSLTDAEGETSSWNYDSAGRLTSMQRPGLGSIGYSYDGNDNQTSISFANSSATISYNHDNLVLNENWSGNNIADVSISRTRDANGNITNVSHTSQGQTFSRSINYDNLDRPTQITDSDNLAVRIGYLGNGTRSYLELPSGLRMDYGYDTANRLTTVNISGQGSVNYTYLNNGLVSGINYANGSTASFDYDLAGRPTMADYLRSNGERTTFSATYHGDGSRQSLSENRGALGTWQTDYHYDIAARLVGYTRSTPDFERTTNYTLDAVGNRLSESVTQTGGGYTRDRSYTLSSGHRVTGFSETIVGGGATQNRSATYSFDANGNRTQKALTEDGILKTHSMQWDARNRMVGLDENGASKLTMHYDDLDRRVRKMGDSRGDIRYVWNELAVLEEYQDLSTNAAPLASYSYGLERLTMERVGGGVYTYTYDMNGSAADLIASDGSLVQAQTYKPFGTMESIVDTAQGDFSRLGFAGHEWDPESELTYAKARFYDQDLGVFTSQDPVLGDFGTPPSLHRYMYAFHNPTRFHDPTGLTTEEHTTNVLQDFGRWLTRESQVNLDTLDRPESVSDYAKHYLLGGQLKHNLALGGRALGETLSGFGDLYEISEDFKGAVAFKLGIRNRDTLGDYMDTVNRITTTVETAAALGDAIRSEGLLTVAYNIGEGLGNDAKVFGSRLMAGDADAWDTLKVEGIKAGANAVIGGGIGYATRGAQATAKAGKYASRAAANIKRSTGRGAGPTASVMKEAASNPSVVRQVVAQSTAQSTRRSVASVRAATSRLVTSGGSFISSQAKQFGSRVGSAVKYIKSFLPCKCFVAGTLVLTVGGLETIETLQVGDRVLTETTTQQTINASPVDTSWVKVELWIPATSTEESAGRMTLLRPGSWLEEDNLEVGHWTRVQIKEKAAYVGQILNIEAAPVVADGPGRVVTATMYNLGKEVIELYVADHAEPIQVTGPHLLYSATRDSYVPAGSLQEGEQLRTRDGEITITRIEHYGTVDKVFDIEVEGDHHYYVSKSGVLSHNCGTGIPKNNIDPYRFSSKSNRWHGPDGKFIHPPSPQQMRALASSKGWTKTKVTNAGFETWSDTSGVRRMKLKPKSTVSGIGKGSQVPRVTIWNSQGQRVDGFGRPVFKKSKTAHAPLKNNPSL